MSEARIFTVGIATGINPVPMSAKGIHFYPNPVNHAAYIDTLKLTDKWYQLQILSIDGKHKFSSMDIANQSTVSLNVSQLSPGVYIAVLPKKNGEAVYIKFIKFDF